MAFVKMKNLRGEEISITKGAVKAYMNLGFSPVDKADEDAGVEDVIGTEEVAEEDEEVEEDTNPMSEDEEFVETILKKPLASWNKEEVKRFAAIKGIDLTGTKSANDAKERIKAFLSDAE